MKEVVTEHKSNTFTLKILCQAFHSSMVDPLLNTLLSFAVKKVWSIYLEHFVRPLSKKTVKIHWKPLTLIIMTVTYKISYIAQWRSVQQQNVMRTKIKPVMEDWHARITCKTKQKNIWRVITRISLAVVCWKFDQWNDRSSIFLPISKFYSGSTLYCW